MPAASDIVETLRCEMRWRHGKVPSQLCGISPEMGNYVISPDEFLLRMERFACHYRKGLGLSVDQSGAGDDFELELALAGSVHAAVASMHGLYPLHASVIAVDGMAVAFAGPSGAGKSTLAASLRQRGFPLLADDLVFLDHGTDRIMALPGSKRLKLWQESMELVGAEDHGLVAPDYPKRYAATEGSDEDTPLPLAAIVMLERQQQCSLEKMAGASRLAPWLEPNCYRNIWAGAQRPNGVALFQLLTRLSKVIPAWLFSRPLERAAFALSVDFIADRLEELVRP